MSNDHGEGLLSTTSLYLVLPRKDMIFFDNLMEAYDGLACIRTLDGMKGIVRLQIPVTLYDDAMTALEAVGKEIPFTFLPGPPDDLTETAL